MSQVVYSRYYLEDDLTQNIAAVPAASKAVGAKMILWTGAPSLSIDTVLADLAVATFTGYATSSAVVWAAPGFEENPPVAVVYSDVKQFTMTAEDATGQSIAGWALVDAAGTHLLMCAYLDNPINVVHNGDIVRVQAKNVRQGQQGA